ncbi:hypothetical protein EIP91_005841 [Steccherinum ochraceum]|uniref:Arrestin-like N-terminal domain-containing protein n=1 Tax=Steccherinum ochraceum TaxID=92696 RepID=A0A4R0R6W9_9APHY|nr:hypothetical protein EIP91_005841 [Steccherinum ochraceum]
MHKPPEYNASQTQPRRRSQNDDRGVQKYALDDSRGQTWMWLNVTSRAPQNSDKPSVLPLFYENDAVEGDVAVDFDKAGGPQGIRVAITAGVTTVGQEEVTFLDISDTLYDAKAANGAKPKGKMTYPFSLKLPSEVSVTAAGPPTLHPLPPSFSERPSNAYIDYKIVVTAKRGMFRVNQTLSTSFVYIPVSRAEPPSRLRQLAYTDSSPLIGPDVDPEGWKVLPPIQVAGLAFNTRPAEVACTFAIAKPLSYAISSPIPLHLTLTSPDKQILDLLSNPSHLKIQLIRERSIGQTALRAGRERTDNTFREPCSTAYLWPTPGDGEDNRVFQGELFVGNRLKPSFSFPGFALKYSVCLLRFDVPGFVPSSSKELLLSENVVIRTTNAPGVVPKSYAPPGYEHREEGNYSNAVGYLENGNQRFYHRGGFQ